MELICTRIRRATWYFYYMVHLELVKLVLFGFITEPRSKYKIYQRSLVRFIESWNWVSEEKLKEIFNLARSSQPAVIFFDEIDAIFSQKIHHFIFFPPTSINLLNLIQLKGTKSSPEIIVKYS